MKNFWRGAILILLLASTSMTFSLFAQELPQGTITGSRLVSDLLAIVAQDSGSEQSFVAQPNGTSAGFTTFCTSGADMTGATRAMTADEELVCTQNGIVYREFLLGYDAFAIIANPDLTFLECLTPSSLNNIFATSTTNSVLDWSQTGIQNATVTPLTLYLPTDDTSLYVLLDEYVSGLGLRTDAIANNDSASVIDAVKNTAGALGVIPASAVTDDLGVLVVSIDNPTRGGCFTPSSQTIENRNYPFATPLYLYVNNGAVDKVVDVLTFAFGESGAESIVNAGYVVPTADATTDNLNILTDETLVGRQFTKEVTAFRIPENIFGTVVFGGNTALDTTFTNIISAFSGQYAAVTVTEQLEGQTVGIRRYCNNELDFIAVTTRNANQSALNPDQQMGCDNNIGASLTIDLGKQAPVLVANGDLRQNTQPEGDAGYNVCLTTDQVLRLWGSNPEIPATNWNMVGDNLPDLELQLIAPSAEQGGVLADLLLTNLGNASLILRDDIAERNDDATYRTTAVSLVPGLTTYMSWQDYQTASQAEGANLQLIAVDSGAGCVVPSLETITDMTYGYTLNHQLIIKQSALARSEVQGVIWYLFQDSTYISFISAGLIGRDDLADLRETLQVAFTDAVTASLTPVVETTPEAESTQPISEETPVVEESTEVAPVIETTPEATELAPEIEATQATEPTAEATP